MDLDSDKIIDFVVLQKGLIVGEAACEKVLDRLKEKMNITLFLSDRHRGIRKLIRTKYEWMGYQFDIWHMAKSLKPPHKCGKRAS